MVIRPDEEQALWDEERERISKYALEVADRSISDQYAEVQSVRQRASYLVAVNAVCIAAFVRFLPQGVEVSGGIPFAGGLWLVAIFLCMVSMMPLGEWKMYQSAEKVIEQYVEGPAAQKPSMAFAIMGIKKDDDREHNEKIVRTAHTLLIFSAVFTVFQFVTWTYTIAFEQY